MARRQITRPENGPTTLRALKNEVAALRAEVAALNQDKASHDTTIEMLYGRLAMFEATLNSMPFWVSIKDTEGRVLFVNEAHAKAHGIDPARVIGKKVRPTTPEGRKAQRIAEEIERKALQTGRVADVQYAHTNAQGNDQTRRLVKAPIRDEDNTVIGVIGWSEDITDRVVAADALDESRRLLRSVVNSVSHFILVKDAEGRVLLANDAFGQRWGVPAESVIGKINPMLNDMPAEEREDTLDADERVLASGKPLVADVMRTLPNGVPTYLHLVRNPLRTPDGKVAGIVLVGEDISRRIEAERRAELAHTRLREAVNSLPASFSMYDGDQRLIVWNDQLETFFPNLAPLLKEGTSFDEIQSAAYDDMDDPKPPREKWLAERRRGYEDAVQSFENSIKGGLWLHVVQRRTSEGGLVRVQVDISKQKEIQRLLEEANERVEHDLQVARELQHSLLPTQLALPFLEGHYNYRPAGTVSGDVCRVTTGPGGEVEIFVGDAAGHDVAAAFLTMMAHAGLESAHALASTDKVIARLNQLIYSMRLSQRFITGTFVRVYPDGSLKSCNAGHPPLIILPADGGAPVLLGESGLPLGLFAGGTVPYVEESHALRTGDRIVLFTDGIVEWANGEGEQFGQERMLEGLLARREDILSEQVTGVVLDAQSFCRAKQCDDDLTLAAFRYTGEGAGRGAARSAQSGENVARKAG